MHCNHCADDNEADIAEADPVHMYYVNDGVYGSFNCILYDHVTVEASLLDVRDHSKIASLFLEVEFNPLPRVTSCHMFDCPCLKSMPVRFGCMKGTLHTPLTLTPPHLILAI